MKLDALPPAFHGYIYHYYRAEIYRETNWRSRLDVTTNWALVVTAAMLSLVFGNDSAPHSIIVTNYILVIYFLYIESRRFRYYMMLKDRTRILEQTIFSHIFSEKGMGKDDLNDTSEIFKSLQEPKIKMSRRESIGWRVRRNYFFLLPLLYIVWLARLTNIALPSTDLWSIIDAGRMWVIPGSIVFTLFTVSIVTLLLMGIYVPKSSEVNDFP